MTTPTAQAQPTGNQRFAPRARLALLALLLFAFALRHYRLGGDSLWYDEIFSAYLAKQSLPALIAHTARDIHPPGYYVLLHLWQRLTAATPAHGLEYHLAWASLAPGLLTVALTVPIARRLGGWTAAIVAGLLAALHPPQVWFGQEVRMYAWGAFFILLTLWAVLQLAAGAPPHPRRPWLTYVAAATAALYTVYYALFWLVVLNLAIAARRLSGRSPEPRRWLAAQVAVVLAYLPWLSTFLHQAVDPPVPPWREPWRSLADALRAGQEALAALAVGHTPVPGLVWPLMVVTLALLGAVFVYAKDPHGRVGLVALLAGGPPALLLAVTAAGWPIYHVRYVALYAPALPVLAGIAVTLPAAARRVTPALLILLLLGDVAGLRELWFNPRYGADDHRAAVADLAAQWRPGDAILVNAGWVYPALDIYWPRELTSPAASLPPDLAAPVRLGNALAPDRAALQVPVIIRTGSVNAPPDLGWALPESDFFAIPAADATAALDDLAGRVSRLWHYRLYDTVSDPAGTLRATLLAHAQPAFSRAYPGPGYLLLERYDFGGSAPLTATQPLVAEYANGLALTTATWPARGEAGRYLYVPLTWRRADLATHEDLAVSLRARRGSQFVAQSDVPLAVDPAAAEAGQTLALPIPAGTPPGALTLSLVVYDPADLVPVPLAGDGDTELTLGTVDLTLPTVPPQTPPPLARFDYIDLVAAAAAPGQTTVPTTLVTHWTWQPRPSAYRDTYLADVALKAAAGSTAAEWRFVLGGEDYPSGDWPANFAVSQTESLSLPADLAPGVYTLLLSVRRASDGRLIPAARRWRWPSSQPVPVGVVVLAIPRTN